MRRGRLLATIALLGAVISSILLGTATQAVADPPRFDIPINRGW